MKLCITGGGTGGHLMIAEALVEAAVKDGHEVIFIGSTKGQDKRYFGEHSSFSHVYFLETTGVVNQKGFAKFIALYKIFKAFLKARSLLKNHQIQATYSVGGFSAAPASLACLSKFLPLFIHEQNAVNGRLNAMLKPFAKRFISAYDENSQIQGYPVKETFSVNARKRDEFKSIIFLGGSHGAKAINDLALSVAKKLDEMGIKIIHQAGDLDYERVCKEYEKLGIDAEVYAFTKELDSLIVKADFAVSRAGASTLWELTTNGCPAFYIPYPYAAGDHQFYNAKFIVDNSMGWCYREDENLEDKFWGAVSEPLTEKSEKLLSYSNKDVAYKMIKDVEEVLK
ncbi:UDP-N-acetylglucosamine--N-acetylmuramyl-(pentapeptide) pyrophosphoryl-undecaprenol N-acetylglucosamine transferase [Sulfurimonas sp.]|jgi:UDP-N-acetylglucosamine--N-acetylmuramyl-(pentapeptide) pyrophosphoryl-undecaprenol N-acetylglucosamine transferase|uniref:UDP-N-acetylglucosamine--N-acetylmuramyl- (pentapeptide) pyrophosphoryl-undecaprenol N-acetylglucosamine transferase n=1 Tax=Sulfurimonas sp. TaxID=2022749 RepID=UPI0025DA112E|nr:UDP-N-acetylglucosamine--N-acetylmuramyl-(pentapeptide) pyrophosphoryl-undecaprenol N-acetylglucosamine transferase [Sulfurimonas sp.]MBT5934077.1 UDP-N-acetylglucosamine--N-acetylmuramyl-(pentapeptide) pyrophosphoryl-undecaprenol N-acetylglucosamine transferase [Sulfurimonas sp.]